MTVGGVGAAIVGRLGRHVGQVDALPEHVARHRGLWRGDAQSLAKNVTRVLENPELAASLAHNAHEESRRYRWEAVREQWLDIYRSLMPRASKFGED